MVAWPGRAGPRSHVTPRADSRERSRDFRGSLRLARAEWTPSAEHPRKGMSWLSSSEFRGPCIGVSDVTSMGCAKLSVQRIRAGDRSEAAEVAVEVRGIPEVPREGKWRIRVGNDRDLDGEAWEGSPCRFTGERSGPGTGDDGGLRVFTGRLRMGPDPENPAWP